MNELYLKLFDHSKEHLFAKPKGVTHTSVYKLAVSAVGAHRRVGRRHASGITYLDETSPVSSPDHTLPRP